MYGRRNYGLARSFLPPYFECASCALRESPKVPPDGRISAEIAFVGEGPGFWEARHGKAFIGRSGKIYERLLANVGLKRKEVWTTNAAMCLPEKLPAKGLSLAKCKKVTCAHCAPRLIRELQSVGPKVIITFGAMALKALTGKDGIQARHGALHVINLNRIGKLFKPGDFSSRAITYVIPLYHPAFLLRGKAGFYPIVAQKVVHARYLMDGGSPTLWRELYITPYGRNVEKRIELLEEFTDQILSKKYPICIDYEADGNKSQFSQPTVFGVGCVEMGLGIAVSVLQWDRLQKHYVCSWNTEQWKRVQRCIQRIQEGQNSKWFHNNPYDVTMGRRFFPMNGKLGDTIVTGTLYQHDVHNTLGFRAQADLLIPAWKHDLKIREKAHGVKDAELLSYNCGDTIFDMGIVAPLVEKINIRKMGHLVNKQMRSTELARRASLNGLPVNRDTLEEIRTTYKAERDGRREKMYVSMIEAERHEEFNTYLKSKRANPKKFKEIGLENFNPRSAWHSRFFLYEHLGLRPLYFTAGGAEEDEAKKYPSHSYKSVLEYMEVPLVRSYVEFWEFGYVITNVLRAYANNLYRHPLLRQLWLGVDWSANSQKGTRFTSFPNVQNVEKKIRKIFQAPPGFVWLGIDLSQVEYRVAACLAGIPELLTLFNDVYFDENKEEWKKYDGRYDGHSMVAESVFGAQFTQAPLSRKKALRTLVKRVVYALFYGAMASKIFHTLRRDRRVNAEVRAILSEKKIEIIRSGFAKRFPQWDLWADNEELLLKSYGFQVYPPLDRRGYVPLADIAGIVKPTELRNVPIQRCAGEVVNDMMWTAEMEAEEKGLDSRFSLHLHDAAYWLVAIDHAKPMLEIVNRAFDIVLTGYNEKQVRLYGQGGLGLTVADVG